MKKKLRPIAIYLPQYHPIKENNEWWGEGFTEWTNVTKATPRFKGHYQPHLSTDMGFYDLRLEETRQLQAELAKAHGIEGFCYYHYWFNGKRILDEPLKRVLQKKKPDFPFCICWANENWTRRWDGMDNEILLKQNYSFEDDKRHMEYLCKDVFSDRRYIKISGKPLFIIYRPLLFPDIKKTIEIWRKTARDCGIGEIYLSYMQSFNQTFSPKDLGFDAAIEFQPDFANFPKSKLKILKKILTLSYSNPRALFKDKIFDYKKIIKIMSSKPTKNYKLFPSIFPGWDNSARRATGATIVHGSTPKLYKKWLNSIVNKFEPYSEDENLIFINAWNEWAEGNHLEPCIKWGRQYLEATKEVFDN